jgi:hypothetical protein
MAYHQHHSFQLHDSHVQEYLVFWVEVAFCGMVVGLGEVVFWAEVII